MNILVTGGCGVRQFAYASSGSAYGIKEEERVAEDLKTVCGYSPRMRMEERDLTC